MSHVVQIQTEVRDPVAVAAACDRLRLAAPRQGTAKLYSDSAARPRFLPRDGSLPGVHLRIIGLKEAGSQLP